MDLLAGWDTLRGVGFQHAVAIASALELIADPDGETLQVEGDADIVDLLVATGGRRQAIQARSRAEPGNWPPGELVAPVKAWLASGPDTTETFEFVSDGPLSRDSALKLIPSLNRFVAGTSSAADHERLESFDLPLDRDLLGRVAFRTRVGSTTQLLTAAVARTGDLGISQRDEAEDAVARLFQQIAIEGGSSDVEKRIFTRGEVAAALGVDLDAIDSGDGWSGELRSAYVDGVTAAVDDPLSAPEPDITTSGIEVDLRVRAENSNYLIDTQELPQSGSLGIQGPAGSGKSTTLRLLARRRAAAGEVPLLVSVASYTRGDLTPRIDRLIARASNRRVRPGIAREALKGSGAQLLLDGLTGLADAGRQAVIEDVRRLREELPNLAITAVDREAALLRRLGLSIFYLSGLDTEQATLLAEAIVGAEKATQALGEIEQQLSDATTNPLLLTMALQLWKEGSAPTSRLALYSSALEALRERSDAEISEAIIELIARTSLRLVADDLYEADRYWWLVALREAMEEIKTQGLYELDVSTAEAALYKGQEIGLLKTSADETAVAFLHDSFRDFFVARSLARDLHLIPSSPTQAWEASLQMLAEADGLSPELTAAALTSIPLAALLAPLDRAPSEERASEAPALIRTLLVNHVGRWPEGLNAEISIAVSYTPDYVYVLLTADGQQNTGVVNNSDLPSLIAAADYVMALPGAIGPLALAFCVWRELIELTTSRISLGGPYLIPSADDEVIDLIANDFRRRQEALAETANELFPTMSERLVAEIGWHGLTARLLPPKAIDLGPGFLAERRTVAYDTRTSALDVAVGTEEDSGKFPKHDDLDMYLSMPAVGSAVAALVKELEQLAPRVDWRNG